MARLFHSLGKFVSRFRRQSAGSVVPMFAIAIIPVFGLAGAALDYSRANDTRDKMQTALDAAVLAGAHDDTANWSNVALNVFNSTFQGKGSSAGTPTFKLNADGTFSGSVSGTAPTSMLGILGMSNINVSVRSTAMLAPTSPSEQYCVLALNLTASPGVQVSGNGGITINAPNCVLQVNSNANTAVDLTGNAIIKSSDNCFVGGSRAVGNSSITPPPLPVCKTVADPFTNYPLPTVGACLKTNYQLSDTTPTTLYPGVYCGGMTFSGHVNVTFSPGTYIVKDGTVTESGGSFTGNGVTFFLTGTGAGFALSGQADWHLVAPTDLTMPFPGFVIFLDPTDTMAADTSQLAGQSELYFEGVIYLPRQLAKITGTATAFAPSPWTSFIADTIMISGNGQFVINNDTTKTPVPIPVGLQMRSGGRLWLTQ